LRYELSAALHKAAFGKEIVRCPGLRVKTNDHFTQVTLSIRPMTSGPAATAEAPLYLILLEESPPAPAVGGNPSSPNVDISCDVDARIASLKQELAAKEAYLQTSNEELETANEELKSANEEMQSVNEELQSTNEELETAKEEMQSVNEELATVNSELQTKVVDLSRANNDMNNLLAGTGIATVFVDHQLRILRFTPTATRIINLIPSDMGRPVGHIVSNLDGYERLLEDTQAVLDTLVPKEVEVRTKTGGWYLLRIQPYRTLDNMIEGAVLTFVNISETKRMQEVLRESDGRFRKLFVEAPLGIALVDSITGHIYEVNPMFAKIAGRTIEEILQTDWMSITHPDDIQEDLDNMALLNAGKTTGFQMVKRYLHHDGTVAWIRMTIAQMKVADKAHPRHLCMIEDITERKRAEEALRQASSLLRLAVVVRDAHDAITVQDMEGRILAWNPGATRMYGWSEAEALAMNVRDRIPEGLREEALAEVLRLSHDEILEPGRMRRLAKDGRILEVQVTATALVNETGQIYAIATTERGK
jgi:two-component system CheB/CheR fusion protein